jgi:hypothetical protein
MTMIGFPVVAFDESGNTGSDLLNKEQPVFALASTSISNTEAERLLAPARTPQTLEVKFSRLKKTAAGRRRIIECLRAPRLTGANVKISFFHKRFLIVTKIVDLLVETMAHQDGLDLYKDGANIALSNLHFYCMPVFCGEGPTEVFLRRFVAMICEQTTYAIRQFYGAAGALHKNARDKKYAKILAPILLSERQIKNVLAHTDKNDLDPAIPAFFEHCSFWGEHFGGPFDLVHDDSKAIFQEKETLENLMSRGEEEHVIGYDRRKFVFPLRARRIQFGRSEEDTRLQVVDLVASAGMYWMTGFIAAPPQKEFWEAISAGPVQKLVLGAVWPIPEVSPKRLETEYDGGVNAVNYMAEFLKKHRS